MISSLSTSSAPAPVVLVSVSVVFVFVSMVSPSDWASSTAGGTPIFYYWSILMNIHDSKKVCRWKIRKYSNDWLILQWYSSNFNWIWIYLNTCSNVLDRFFSIITFNRYGITFDVQQNTNIGRWRKLIIGRISVTQERNKIKCKRKTKRNIHCNFIWIFI